MVLDQPRLNKDAVPCIFPNCPEYLNSSTFTREEPEAKKRRIELSQLENVLAESLKTQELHNLKFKVDTLDELKEKVNCIDLSNGFTPVSIDNGFSFVKVILNNNVPKYFYVIIDINLSMNVFIDHVNLKKIDGLTFPITVKNVQEISQVLCSLDKYSDMSGLNEIKNLINSITLQITELENLCSNNEKLGISFIKEQLSLTFSKRNQNRYSADFLIFSSLILSISPHAYNFLRSSDYLILPHPSTIKRLIASYNLDPKNETCDENFLNYIKQKFSCLCNEDKNVTLMMDEVHLKPYLDFKGGSILGMSYNCKEAANSAYVFMIQSVKSNYKDVVSIMPVKTVNSDLLYNFLKKVLIGLELVGFHTFCVLSDNNSINRKAMSNFITPPKVQVVYQHPFDSNRKLFFMIDSVHIVKCVRNNWLGKKDSDFCMFYPEFPSENQSNKESESLNTASFVPSKNEPLKTASFVALRKLYEFEQLNLVKYAHSLNTKSLFPSNIERQNVKLALNIFNRQLIAAMHSVEDKCHILDLKATAGYIEIFVNWWDVMNVKSITKGFHKRNIYQDPLKKDDFRFTFLLRFLEWLKIWKISNSNKGKLTPETHLALSLTTEGMIEVCRYCTDELKMHYILPGKFQTDSLEARFGKYRQLAGGQYDISITQLFEGENKMRLQSTLPLVLNSNVYGHVAIDINDVEDDNDSELVDSKLSLDHNFAVKVTKIDLNEAAKIMPVIVYIAGYAIHSTLKYLNNCSSCKTHLTRDKELNYLDNDVLIHHQDRGGLKYPTDDAVIIVTYCYVIVTKLLSDFEESFLKVNNQRTVALKVIKNVLVREEKYLEFDICDNDHSVEIVSHCILKKVINVLLNNYCKLKNDKISYASYTKSKERKLKTLMKSIKNQS